MARKAAAAISEGELTKGQVRKLNALRKSVGDKIGTRAFADWLSSQRSRGAPAVDRNAEMIVSALEPLVKQNKLRIPRGGYLVKRGRGRVIVDRARIA